MPGLTPRLSGGPLPATVLENSVMDEYRRKAQAVFRNNVGLITLLSKLPNAMEVIGGFSRAWRLSVAIEPTGFKPVVV